MQSIEKRPQAGINFVSCPICRAAQVNSYAKISISAQELAAIKAYCGGQTKATCDGYFPHKFQVRWRWTQPVTMSNADLRELQYKIMARLG